MLWFIDFFLWCVFTYDVCLFFLAAARERFFLEGDERLIKKLKDGHVAAMLFVEKQNLAILF